MADSWLTGAIRVIDSTGFFTYVIPFMIVFAVLYGFLEKTKLFGKGYRRINLVLSAVIGLMVLPFVSGVDYTTYVSKLVFIVIAVVFTSVILGIFGKNFGSNNKAIAFGVIVGILLVLSEFLPSGFFSWFSSDFWYATAIVAVFLLIAWFVMKPEPVSATPPRPASQQAQQPQRQEQRHRARRPPTDDSEITPEEAAAFNKVMKRLREEQEQEGQ